MTDGIESVCFDLDDTLYPYSEYARTGLEAAADRIASRTGRRFHDRLRSMYFDEGLTDRTFDRLVADADLQPDTLDGLIDAFHGATAPLSPYPATESVLSTLGEEQKLGLITDGQGGYAKLDRLDLADHFEVVTVTPETGRSKHDSEVFEDTVESLGVRAAETVYVGDDPRVDFHHPNLLGMWTVRLRQGRYADLDPTTVGARPDREIESLAALPDVVSELDERVQVPGETDVL